jgi:exodeoxyribonuclease V gamma subunit
MLQITLSNRCERLEAALLDAIAVPPESVFTPHEVIVPSMAWRRRVEFATATRFRIGANVRFSFLAQWLWRQIGHVVKVSEVSPFTTPVLTWRILGTLADAVFVEPHRPLAAYLRSADNRMRYELAARVAGLFEHYLTYRPDWLAAWLAGKPAGIEGLDAARAADERWQAELWRRIVRDLGAGSRHPSVAFFDAMQAMGPGAPARAGLPQSAHVFCLPTTPPLYLDILQRLAQWIDLRLYVVNPCREYWFDIVDAKRLSWLAAGGRADHHEVGNRLLAAWGKETRAHIDLLLGGTSEAVIDDAEFAPAEGTTLLARIQNAILDLVDLAPGSVALAADDRSIEVHVCHSLARELEVLHDQLLGLFALPDPPRPADVVVVTPDLETAATQIDAVFGNVPAARAIPYTITGRPASVQNPCARALLAVLATATSRFHASAVFELLQQPIVARRFGVGAAALERIHDWIRAAGIRWGIDGRHRAALDLPATERHSFGDGLDRLFLDYALPASLATPVNGRLGAGNAEGSEATALGSFFAFFRALERLHAATAKPMTPDAWRETLLSAIDAFMAPEGDEIDAARDAAAGIHELHRDMTNGGLREPQPVDVLCAALQAQLDEPTRGGVPGGAVTFASMTSLRGLPYRFVCAIGLGDGAFPSVHRPDEFDLMARAPRRGDRQRRDDQRNVFLDLVVAARERLYLSYTGRSVRDNSPLPPSVLIDELLDCCAEATATLPYTPESLARARQRLIVEHPLQAFSVEYFLPGADPRRRSFNDEYCAALRQQLAPVAAPAHFESDAGDNAARSANAAGADDAAVADDSGAAEADAGNDAWEPQRRFFVATLPAAGAEFHEVALADLARFFRNPCRYLLRERLGVVLPEGDEELADDEPFVADWRARDALAQRVLPCLLAGAPAAEVREFARAGVEYPPGRMGDLELEQELRLLEAFAARLGPALGEPTLDFAGAPVEFDLDGEPWRLTGTVNDLRASGLVRYRYADAHARDYLAGWLAHLYVNTAAPPGVARCTEWHSRDGRYALREIADARPHLTTLLRLYRDGLRRPLHFFPKAAWAFVCADRRRTDAMKAWKRADGSVGGEGADPAYELALRGIGDPLDAEFEACADMVFAPLLAHLDDPRLRKRKPREEAA